ncbi:hypothetical protein GC163_13605 [bacterium]|nr:hypothetical protein [bacterium]
MFVHRYPAMEPATQPEHSVSLTTGMWWKLLTRPMLPPRSRLLVVGSRPLDVAELLINLAYDVTGLCLTAEAVIEGRRTLPLADFQLWSPGARELPWDAEFDLVLITDFLPLDCNLYDLACRLETSALLAALKPASRCLALCTAEDTQHHSPECWRRHLACFPGHFQTQTFHPTLWRRCRSYWHKQPTPRAVTAVSLRVPEMALSFSEWKAFARAGMLTGKGTCCQPATHIAQPLAVGTVSRRVA